MSRTKNAAELYGLVVEETYGVVPYRIFTLLLLRGRQSVSTLAQHTRLSPRHVRHGLVVLIQQNLVYFHTEEDSEITFYEADQEASYFLLRSGKIIEYVSSRYGPVAQDLVQNLLFLGHAKIGDLLAGSKETEQPSEVHTNGNVKNKSLPNGIQNGSKNHTENFLLKDSEDSLTQLLESGLVTPVVKLKLQSPSDLYHQVENEILGSQFHHGTKGPKQKDELKGKVVERLREIRAEGEVWQQKGAKRGYNDAHTNGGEKQQKIPNGAGQIRYDSSTLHSQNTQLDLDLTVRINYEKCKVVLRNQQLISLARVDLGETTSRVYGAFLRLLEARIPRCQLDSTIDDPDDITEGLTVTTMELAQAMDKSILPSYGIGRLDGDSVKGIALEEPRRKRKRDAEDLEADVEPVKATTSEKSQRKRKRDAEDSKAVIESAKTADMENPQKRRKRHAEDAEALVKTVKTVALGKPQKKRRRDEEDSEAALESEKRSALDRPYRKRKRDEKDSEATIESAISSDEDRNEEEGLTSVDKHGNIPEVDQDSDSFGDSSFTVPSTNALAVKPLRASRVTFDENLPKPVDRDNQMHRTKDIKNHLLLLADYSPPFVRRCGTRGLGEWTVDFDKLVKYMQETEMSDFICEAHGKLGWRMARILSQKGKLDEKQIQKFGLLKLSDVRTTLFEMQLSGIVDIQEIPKDTVHVAARTIFLWYFDPERAKSIVLDRIYKTMSRCLQVLKVDKYRHREVLSQAERTDVKGMESEMLPPIQLARLNEIRDSERRVFTQIGRLDTMVAILKDF